MRKKIKSYIYFFKSLHLRSLTGFWVRLSLTKYSLTCRVTSLYVLYDIYSEPCLLSKNSNIFRDIHVILRHIQTYCGIFRTLCYSCVFRTLPYVEPKIYPELCQGMFWNIHVQFSHIQLYFGIFRTVCNSCIFRILAYLEPEIRHILAYSERCVSLAYWETCQIQNFAIYRILVYLGPEEYSESCLFRHIQAYSGIFDNECYNKINFLFFSP